MQRHIIYIINPISGTRDKNKLRSIIEKNTTARNISFEIFPSVASGDYSFVAKQIEEVKATDVVIAGGDGTVSQVVNSLMHCKVNFGIIPCGSGNGLAYTAGIPKQPEKALELIFLGKAHAIDGFTVNGQFACMLSGLGFDARVAHEFARQPKRGLATYTRQVFKHFMGAGTYNFTIATKEKKFTTAAYLISIANSNQFGNNVKIAPKASLTDGLLDVVIVTSQNKVSLLIQTMRQLGGFIKIQSLAILDETRSIIYFQTDKLSIENLSEAPLHIDGDPAETPNSLDIKICKQCFRLIQPS